jgi:hypothetical protein
LVLGTWYLVLGTWYLVLGTWYLICSMCLVDVKYCHDFSTKRVYLTFVVFIKIQFSIHLEHSSFWPPADVRHMSNELVHEIYGLGAKDVCSLSLSLSVLL